ncbi:phosphate regulon sensor protein phor (sphs) [hydrocarbon metagenome]|uniref:histidine kinase n=1 Tax=hydrocarbon metagenome TaxID=938273 RepID=A0A0W8FM92_9ZZZZ
MKKNLFYKIFFSYLVIICTSFFILDLFLQDEVKDVLTSRIETELLSYAKIIDQTSPEKALEHLNQVATTSKSRITLIDARGKVFADSEKDVTLLENHLNRPEVQEARLKGSGKSVRFSASLGIDMLYVATAVKDEKGIKSYIRLARPLHDVQNVIDKVYQYILLTIFIVAVISLLIALFFSYRLYEPIKTMEQFTERLRRGDPVGSIILDTSDETKTLADNINYLVEELKDKIRIANEEKSKLMAAFTSMNEGVLIVNAQGVIEFVSPVLSNMLAVQYSDVSGKTLMEAFRSVDLHKAFLDYKEKRENVSREIIFGSVEPVILNVSISAVYGHPDEEKTMIVFHDVTRLKKLEQVRADFVVNVTHEIKTPLTAIIGYLETIKNGAINNIQETQRFIDIILKQAERLNRLVDDLLIISNIEMKETKLKLDFVSLNNYVTNVISLVEAKAKSKNITIHNHVSEKIAPVKADRDKLTQIFVNVLDNAVKFTPDEGDVFVEADEMDAYIVVSVNDTGIGVPSDEIQRLGERFYRVDKSRSRDLGGTGLGLSIVKHLMIAHGGKMEIESQLGRGTKVSLFFHKETE